MLPSASNAGLRARCAGAWQLIQALRSDGRLSEKTNQAALEGQAIHEAIASGSDELEPKLLETKKLLEQMEQRLVHDWDELAVLLAREQRLWYRRGIAPIATGRYDFAYRSLDWSKVLIGDYKSGREEVPAAHLNDQLRELAALYYCQAPDSVTEITVAICQPWVSRKPSVAVYSLEELRFAVRLLAKNLEDISDPDAVRTPGVHCSYCPAVSYCEEHRVMLNSVLSLVERFKKGDYELPTGRTGATFLRRALEAHRVLEIIIEKYKEMVRADPNAIPGYYLKAGNTRQVLSEPELAFNALALEIPEFLACGKFSLTQLLKAYTKHSGLPQAEAEPAFWSLLKGAVITVQNEPSLAKESPRRGRPKELTQTDLLP